MRSDDPYQRVNIGFQWFCMRSQESKHKTTQPCHPVISGSFSGRNYLYIGHSADVDFGGAPSRRGKLFGKQCIAKAGLFTP